MLDQASIICVKQIIEALLFVSSEPLTFKKMREIVCEDYPISTKEFRCLIDSLKREYISEGRAFILEEIGGGFRLKSHPAMYPYLSRLKPEKKKKISMAASEVLAIVAYRQPVTRHEVELIRGVESSGHLTALLERSLIEVVGKKEVPGRPSIFGTTKHFLQHFGLKSLSDLPKL
jgi:segregation and condensation protein B